MNKKILVLVLCAILTVGLLASCGENSTDNGEGDNTDSSIQGEDSDTENSSNENAPSNGNSTFTYAIGGDTGNTLNPLSADDRWGLMVCHLLYSQLYFIYPDGTIDYILADSIEASEDGLEYTLKLKEGLKWSDGTPLTADDVVFTFESKNKSAQNLFVDGKPIEVQKIDDTTVKFVAPSISASITELISSEISILPKHVFEGRNSFDINMLEEEVVGNGPYTLEEYKTGQYIKFKKNENYAKGVANVDTVIYKIIQNNDTASLALQNMEVDAFIGLPNLIDPFTSNENFKVENYSENRVAYLKLNRVSDNMQDLNYRKGILHALDKNEIMLASYSDKEFFELGYSFLPEENEFYTDELQKWEQDIEMAKELTKDGPKKLKLVYIQDDEAQSNQALTIQAELKAIGIDLELFGVNQAALVKMAFDNENKDYDMSLGGYIMGVDPEAYSILFATNKQNIMNFDSKEIDEMFAKGNATLDLEERRKIYNELQAKIADEALFYPFGSNLRTLVMNARVGNIEEAKLVPIYTFGDLSKLTVK